MSSSYVVTGGGRGVGRAIAGRLAADGGTVVIIERDEAALDWVPGHPAAPRLSWVTGSAADERVAEAAAPLAGWVNNAALFRDAALHTAEPAAIMDLISANLAPVVTGCAVAVRRFLAAGRGQRGRTGGSIVNVSSHQAQRAVRGALPYATAKAAIEGLTRAAAVDYGPERIRVNAVALGSIDTDSPSNQYDILAYRTHPGTLPLGWVSVVFEELWPLFLVFVAILLWVFPDGKLPAGRWRRPSVVLLVSGLLLGVVASTSGVIVVARGDVRIRATGDLANPPGGGFEILDIAVIALSLVAWLAWILIQIPTYRRADGERRQQLKWLYSGATVTLVAFVFGVFVIPVAAGHAPGYPNNPVISALVVLAFGAMPASLGVAVLKYRLYELDRIISRVVSYALITTLLVGFYTGLVLLTTHVLPYKSAVAVAACTLITAALFNPLRKRVQRLVDRRFNRSRGQR